MASLFKQSVVLSSARAVTYIVQFLSAVVLVRILAPEAYGRYQEFLVYTMLAASFIEFAINNNLTYFVSKDPAREAQYLTNTTFLNFVFCVIGVAVLFAAKGYLVRVTTYDFVNVMIIYLIAYVNLNYLEFYWVARGKTTHILYYSMVMVLVRTVTVVSVAYLTRDVFSILYAVVAVQMLKCLFVGGYLVRRRLLLPKMDAKIMRLQLTFVLPLGVAAVILYFNNEISKVIVSSQLGAVALAMYAIGSRQIPVAGIIRGSASTVIFPEIVRQNIADPALGLDLWKRANVAFTFMMIPIFYMLFYYADVIITTLFTEEYARAVPIFRIHLFLLLLRDIVETGSPLRALNQNKFFIYGNVMSLAVNIVSLYVLFKLFGFFGPAIALVLTILALQIFLCARIAKSYGTGWRRLLMWKKHAAILAAGAVCLPVAVLGDLVIGDSFWGAVAFGVVYCVAYALLVRRLRIEEVDRVMSKIVGRVGLAW